MERTKRWMKHMGILMLLCCLLGLGARAEETDYSALKMQELFAIDPDSVVTVSYLSDLPYYSKALAKYREEGFTAYTGEDIAVQASDWSAASGDAKALLGAFGAEKRPGLRWTEELEWVEYTIQAPEDGLYSLEMVYHALENSSTDAVRALYVDGRTLYRDAANFTFRWTWEEAHAPVMNPIGDELTPPQVLKDEYLSDQLHDTEGFYSSPVCIALTKGAHTFRLGYVTQAVVLHELRLIAPEQPRPYSEVRASYPALQPSDEVIAFEAEENVISRNNSSLHRVADFDPATVPYVAGYKRLNAIGGSYWANAGKRLEWRFEVKTEGLYRLDLRVLQSATEGMPVFRRIEIDHRVPFAELEAYPFPYAGAWQNVSLTDEDGEPFLFHLTPGVHTLAMEVTLGDFAGVIQSLTDDTELLSDYLLQLLMLTGPNPDINYEYEVMKNLPGTLDVLNQLKQNLRWKADALNRICSGRTSVVNLLEQEVATIDSFIRDPEKIPRRSSTLAGTQTSLTTWYTAFQSQPLTIDSIAFCGADAAKGSRSSTTFQQLGATWQNFLTSFSKDYDQVGLRAEKEREESVVLDVWVSMGVEAAEVLKSLIDDRFSAQTGIYVNMNILPAGQLNAGAVNALMLALISGNEPDVVLNVANGSPVEFAIRGAVSSLSDMEGFEELAASYPTQSLISNSLMGKVYGLPERMDFRVLFYRTDILSSLGMRIPDTWEEVYSQTLPVLAQNSMQMYVPTEYQTFLFQNGGSYYRDGGLTSNLDTPEAYQAFKSLVELYTNYGVPFYTSGSAQLNFFNGFRIGTIPIGIGGYNEYLQLLTAAPDIAGKWSIALIPGLKQADGTINRSYGTMVTTCSMMMASSDQQEAGWELLKWWLSDETQALFCAEIESRIGITSRVNTANINAFSNLAWDRHDLKVIEEARSWIVETPGALGGAYAGRHITNAWNSVIVDNQLNLRSEWEDAVTEINKEMQAYQAEYRHLLKEATDE